MNPAKIQFSSHEIELVQNAEWILTKRAVIQKMVQWLGSMSQNMSERLQDFPFASSIAEPPPKISKGENYKGLPYVILDYPRSFGREDVFAVRTLFWWAHYCSITLHLKGQWQRQFSFSVWRNRKLLADAGFYISIGADEWEHAVTSDDHLPLVNDESINPELFTAGPFLKLVAILTPDQWERLDEWLMPVYTTLLRSLMG